MERIGKRRESCGMWRTHTQVLECDLTNGLRCKSFTALTGNLQQMVTDLIIVSQTWAENE